ncbi:excinuclease ABC [Striga asiatica]|uniref:Excinuclease ABC n=1 Tax=Striga asiatica TaxID=4170 RepID=A0A5A7PD03_STRAF|nr:excinuclease ABC [Striga asiatica]
MNSSSVISFDPRILVGIETTDEVVEDEAGHGYAIGSLRIAEMMDEKTEARRRQCATTLDEIEMELDAHGSWYSKLLKRSARETTAISGDGLRMLGDSIRGGRRRLMVVCRDCSRRQSSPVTGGGCTTGVSCVALGGWWRRHN